MGNNQSTSPLAVMVRLVEDTDQLVRLQVDLASQEARQVAARNRRPVLLLVGGVTLAVLAVLVALPALLVVLLPWHWQVAAGWLVLYLVAAAITIPLGRSGLHLGLPQTTAIVKETEEWVLRQARSFVTSRPR
jgi:hypothetical protein